MSLESLHNSPYCHWNPFEITNLKKNQNNNNNNKNSICEKKISLYISTAISGMANKFAWLFVLS